MPGVLFEGGSFRAIFSCGVMDALLDQDVMFPYCIGVSAGAADSASYISRQKERNLNMLLRYRNDKRYMGLRNYFKKEHSLFGVDFVFRKMPNVLFPFDMDTFQNYAGDYVVVTTDANTGKPHYFHKEDVDDRFDVICAIKPLSGDVEQGDYLEIGYFEQETPAGIETTCLEEIWQEFPGYTQYEVRSALAKCGLTTKHIESKVKVLSGGEQAKVRLCKLINRESNILVLDEPTNHLDVDAKDELKRALMAYKGSILMVCHEPEFYDGLATDVWDCGKWTTRI